LSLGAFYFIAELKKGAIMDFELIEEHRLLQDTVRRFVRQELLTL